MTETEKRALMGGCDGSCLDHPENPNYCKPVCDVRKLWKEARAVDVSREMDYGLFLHPDDGKRPRWIPRRYQTLPQARAVRARLRDARRLAKSEGFIVPPRIRIWRLDHHGNPASLLPLRPPKAKPKRIPRQKPRLRHS